jgi:hypothetical protein
MGKSGRVEGQESLHTADGPTDYVPLRFFVAVLKTSKHLDVSANFISL